MEHAPSGSTPRVDARLDLAAGSAELLHGRIAFVHPRNPGALPFEEDPAAGEAYPPHWAQPWPSALELAFAVSAGGPGAGTGAGSSWRGAAVLELGCGLGLPAIAAAIAGARVLATDRSADAVGFAAVNAGHNGAVVETAVCSWTHPAPLVARAPWRVVLASDVLYGQRNVDELLDLLPRLVDDSGEVWIADPQRPLTTEFLDAARASWRSVETVPTRVPRISIHRLAGPPPAGTATSR